MRVKNSNKCSLYIYIVFSQMRLLRFVHSVDDWLDIQFEASKIGRKTIAGQKR